MKLIDIRKKFNSEDTCLDYLEQMRWPKGEICCVHCGEIGRVSKITRRTDGRNKRTRIYQCMACGKQFSATSGTIFNDTHLPLVKWFTAIALFCEAKKGVSACQLERHLGVNYRTAWHLAHRIREAMKHFGSPGGYQMVAQYLGDANNLPSQTHAPLTVVQTGVAGNLTVNASTGGTTKQVNVTLTVQ